MLFCLFLSLPFSAKLLIRLNSVYSFVFSTLALTLQTAFCPTIPSECWSLNIPISIHPSKYVLVVLLGTTSSSRGSLSIRGPGEQGMNEHMNQSGGVRCSVLNPEHSEKAWKLLVLILAASAPWPDCLAVRPAYSLAPWCWCLSPVCV